MGGWWRPRQLESQADGLNETNYTGLKSNFRKTPVKGILKSRPVTPEVIVDNVNIVERSKEVADKALNLLNPYRQIIYKNFICLYGSMVLGSMSNARRAWRKLFLGGKMRTRIQTLLTKISPEGNFCSTLVLTGTEENLMSAFALLRWTRWENV